MGTTYEAEDLTNYQRVAVKALSLRQIKEWKVLELFEREARVLANLEHPAIPKYLDYFPIETSNNRSFYLVQELVRGDSLADLVEKGWHPNESEVKHIAVQILNILNYLHQLTPPVIHRDIKPQNIIRCPNGTVFLVDFGAVQEVYRNTLTRGGTFVGTLGYVPQEQFTGSVQAASDLYSLGATLLFLLTKKSPDELPLRRMQIDFRRYVKVSPEFADWLEKMLEPAIEDRFESAKIALEALQGNKKVTFSVPLPTESKIDQPNRFRVERSERHLVVKILPSIKVGMLIKSFLFFSFLFLLLWSYSRSSALLFVILPLVLINQFTYFLFIFASRIHIEIDQHNFRVQWITLGETIRQIQGKTTDIERIERLNIGKKSNKMYGVIFWEGVRGFKLLLQSSQEEQWLIDEASDFLTQLRYGKQSQQ